MRTAPMAITKEICGNKVVLVAEGEDRPTGVYRIGSVPLKFEDGSTVLIRVYGLVKIYTDPRHRMNFEKELRIACEAKSTIDTLFGEHQSTPTAVRFNAANAQVRRGWYWRNQTTEPTIH